MINAGKGRTFSHLSRSKLSQQNMTAANGLGRGPAEKVVRTGNPDPRGMPILHPAPTDTYAKQWQDLAKAETIVADLHRMMGKGGEYEDVRLVLQTFDATTPRSDVEARVNLGPLDTLVQPASDSARVGNLTRLAGSPINLAFMAKGPALTVGESDRTLPMFTGTRFGSVVHRVGQLLGTRLTSKPTVLAQPAILHLDIDKVRAQLEKARLELPGIARSKIFPQAWKLEHPWAGLTDSTD